MSAAVKGKSEKGIKLKSRLLALIDNPKAAIVSIMIILIGIFTILVNAIEAINEGKSSIYMTPISLLSIVFSIYLAPRAFYAFGHAFANVFAKKPNSDDIGPLLPSQRETVLKLKRLAVGEGGRFQPGSVIPLKGEWGVGKSTIIQHFKASVNSNTVLQVGNGPEAEKNEGEDKAEIACVYFDAFTNEAFPQPEFALFKSVATQWRIMWPFGWLVMPILRLFVLGAPITLKLALKRGESTADVQTQLDQATPPQILWYSQYCLLVKLALRRVARVVIIVDEIDRCSPEVAQKYVTLIRRFLTIPGVTVIVPYVEKQIRFKVFDPLQTTLADLASTSQVILWDEFHKEARRGMLATINKALQNGNDKGGDGRNINTSERMKLYMLKGYLASSPSTREKLMRQMEEKYLLDKVVFIDFLTKEDFLELIRRHPMINALADQVQRMPDAPEAPDTEEAKGLKASEETEMQRIVSLCERLWSAINGPPEGKEKGNTSNEGLTACLTARSLNGELNNLLSRIDLDRVSLSDSETPDKDSCRFAIVMAIILTLRTIDAVRNKQPKI